VSAVKVRRLVVRPPAPGDVHELERLERLCFPDPWPGAVILAEVGAAGRFHRVAASPDGRLLGYLFAAWQYLDLHVLKVATDPEARRRGIATRLMHAAVRHARELGAESVTLEVRRSNLAAQRLYLGLGFSVAGRRPRYYGDGEDALVMTLPLARRGRMGP